MQKKTLNDFFSKWWEFLLLAERLKTTTTTSQWPTLATSTCSRPTPRYSDHLFFFLRHHPRQCDPHCILIDDTMKIPFQRKLMQQKTLICYSLNVALWFFGHNATTAVGQVLLLLDNMSLWSLSWPPLLQEDLTGMDTGMKDYLTLNHPDLLDKLTPNYYDEIFVVPWATNRQFEKFNTLIQNDSMSSSWWPNWRINESNHFFGRREVEETHKDLLQSVGKTLRGEQWEHLNWKFKIIDNLNWKSVGKTLRGEH